MARQAGTRKQKKNLYLRSDLCERYDFLLTPLGETKPPHGAWSTLVEKLLWTHWKSLPEAQRESIEKRLAKQKQKELDEVMELTKA